MVDLSSRRTYSDDLILLINDRFSFPGHCQPQSLFQQHTIPECSLLPATLLLVSPSTRCTFLANSASFSDTFFRPAAATATIPVTFLFSLSSFHISLSFPIFTISLPLFLTVASSQVIYREKTCIIRVYCLLYLFSVSPSCTCFFSSSIVALYVAANFQRGSARPVCTLSYMIFTFSKY